MRAFIVIPCLNEEGELEATCASLGFGLGAETGPADTTLILVDNGSTDRTPEIMQHIWHSSREGAVVVTHESEQGFVPPRRRGIEHAAEIAEIEDLSQSDVLILQADADTRYQPGYVAAMLAAGEASEPLTLVEGRAAVSSEFSMLHPTYQALAERVDASVQSLCVADTEDVIVDDKICAFRLSDYLVWGGHVREYDLHGEEIHAETTRLFMRGKSFGATKTMVDGAVAQPSRRKVDESPALYFATAGFPHGRAWSDRWLGENVERDTFDMTGEGHPHAILVRQCHDLVLFGILPVWIGQAVGTVALSDPLGIRLSPLLALLPSLTPEQIRDAPGWVLSTALDLIDTNLSRLELFLSGYPPLPFAAER